MELQQVMGKKDEQQMLNPNMYTPQEVAPLSQQKGIGEQFGDMAKQKIMSGAVDKGTEALISGATTGGEAMLGSSAMAGLGTAMPYVGAGLMAGKALGLFNAGGMVGPLSAQYNYGGGMAGVSMSGGGVDGYSGDGGFIKKYITNPFNKLYNMYFPYEGEDLSYDSSLPDPRGKYSNSPAVAEAKARAKKMGTTIDPRAYGTQYNAQGTMSKEQAMALMNNQPEPTPMPMARPEDLYDEIIMEQIGPLARPQMEDYGADRTHSPYDMLRPDNAPNT